MYEIDVYKRQVIILGTPLLCLPVSSASGKGVYWLDALFTATTSVCVTGLVTVPTATTWSVFGKIVILGLIQFGGLGTVSYTHLDVYKRQWLDRSNI